MTKAEGLWSTAGMSNVLDNEQQHRILTLGRLGWSLRRIEEATTVRRETISEYLKAAGIPVRSRGGRARTWPPPKPATTPEVSADPTAAKSATTEGVSTDSATPRPTRAPSASACEIYREVITEALSRGRNAMAIWQDLVDDHGCTARYASVRRFVVKLRGATPVEARVVVTTAIGEDYGESPVMVSPEEARRCERCSSGSPST